jgi:tight adherence protein B
MQPETVTNFSSQGESSWLVWVVCGIAALFIVLAALHYFSIVTFRYKTKVAERLNYDLPRLFLFTGADRLLFLNAGIAFGIVVLVWWLTDSFIPTIVAALGCGAIPSLTLGWLKRQRLNNLALQFPDFVSLLASALKAGSSLNIAIASVSTELSEPLRQEINLVIREQKLGLSIDESLAQFAQRTNLEDFTLMCAAVRISRSSGGNLAETLESLANTSRRKLALEGKIRSLTAQGKLQGWVMAALPFVLGLALFQIEPRAMRPLVTTWYGWSVVAVVVTLQLTGLHFIRRIVRIDI